MVSMRSTVREGRPYPLGATYDGSGRRLTETNPRGGVTRSTYDTAGREIALEDATVGKGNWVLGLTADHGAMPSPTVSGAFQISTTPVARL